MGRGTQYEPQEEGVQRLGLGGESFGRPGRWLHPSVPLGFSRADKRELDGRREKHLASQGSGQSLSEQEEGLGSSADSE